MRAGGISPEAVAWFEREVAPHFKAGGQLYQAEIPEDSDLLDWDKPLSEQPEKLREALAQALRQRRSVPDRDDEGRITHDLGDGAGRGGDRRPGVLGRALAREAREPGEPRRAPDLDLDLGR